MTKFNHIILTRFNMREDINNSAIPSDKWHEERFQLFERFCFPSVKSQININFKWLVFFDLLTPKFFLPRIESYAAEMPNFIPIFSDDLGLFKEHLQYYLESEFSYLITSRLDNDDAISNDFIECVQKQFNNQELEFINFYDGYIVHKNRLYNHQDKSNAFLSLIEKVSDQPYKTVWCTMHHKASKVADIVQIKNNPTWLQVIHSTNVSNRVKGIRTKNHTQIEKKFKISFEWDDSLSFYWIDFLCLSFLRVAREIFIKELKMIISR